MGDVVFVAIMFAFFGVALAFLRGCESIVSQAGEPAPFENTIDENTIDSTVDHDSDALKGAQL